jgi:hypothetical protein
MTKGNRKKPNIRRRTMPWVSAAELRALQSGRTVVGVAHRLSTVVRSRKRSTQPWPPVV